MSKKDSYKKISIAFLLAILLVALIANATYLNAMEWRSNDKRDSCFYNVDIYGLSGKEVAGTTIILVPIPATSEGQFLEPPSQKEPTFMQKVVHEYISHTPESKRLGPTFKNTSELLDNKSIRGSWTTFIAETDDGYMMGFRTNESILDDISLSKTIVVDNIDIFDPVNNKSLILYPLNNLSNISMMTYGDQTKYSSNPTYESYVYLSNNLINESIYFEVSLRGHNDHTKWPEKYRGSYKNYIGTEFMGVNVNDSGKVRVSVSLEQSLK